MAFEKTTWRTIAAGQAVRIQAQDRRIEVLERALRDCLSTYRTDELEVIVTAERQEAWIAALRGDS